MQPSEEGDPHSSTQPGIKENAEAFESLTAENGARRNRQSVNKFVKKLKSIPEISLPPTFPRRASISLAERGLVGQFTGLWPSPKLVKNGVEINWNATTQGKIEIRFYGRGYYTFLFETRRIEI